MQGEEWLSEFDETCYSHPGPWDARSTVEVLAAQAALPIAQSFSFPHAVYLKLMANPSRCDSDPLFPFLREPLSELSNVVDLLSLPLGLTPPQI